MSKMRPEVANRRIESFRKRFGKAHLYLAYHAAFPLALTPDLLYLLWANFQRDIHSEMLSIPWIAVADLLLSSLCDEVGHELYEMDMAVRNVLLSRLKEDEKFAQQRINELSDFLLDYVQKQLHSDDPDIKDFAQAQQWTALAYTRPSEAARQLALAFSKVEQKDTAELVRMASLTETFAEPLAEFQPLLIYARGIENFARGNLEAAKVQLGAVLEGENQIRVAGVNLPVPKQIKTNLSPSDSTWLKNGLKNKLLVGSSIILLVGLGGHVYWQNLGRTSTLIGHSGDVNSLAFSREGTTLVSGGDDKTVKLWNLNNKQEIRTLKGHKDIIYSVAISPDGQTLVSGSQDNTIKVWNLNTGQEIRTLKGHSSFINCVAITPDSQKIASGSYDKTIKVWDLNTGQEIRTLEGHTGHILSVVISPDGQKIASASADRSIKVWNLNTGKEIRTLNKHLGDVNALAISPDGQLLVSTSDDRTVTLWNLNTAKEIRTFQGHTADVNAVAFSPDGEKIATGSDDSTVKIWNLSTGQEMHTYTGHSGEVYAVAFSPDGKTILSASKDKTIKIWPLP